MASRRRRRQSQSGGGRSWHDLTRERVAPRDQFRGLMDPVSSPFALPDFRPVDPRRDILPRGLYGPFVSGAVIRPPRVPSRPGAREHLQFRAPSRVLECVRRQVRREVLHALGVAGRRGLKGRGGSYRRGSFSEVSCR